MDNHSTARDRPDLALRQWLASLGSSLTLGFFTGLLALGTVVVHELGHAGFDALFGATFLEFSVVPGREYGNGGTSLGQELLITAGGVIFAAAGLIVTLGILARVRHPVKRLVLLGLAWGLLSESGLYLLLAPWGAGDAGKLVEILGWWWRVTGWWPGTAWVPLLVVSAAGLAFTAPVAWYLGSLTYREVKTLFVPPTPPAEARPAAIAVTGAFLLGVFGGLALALSLVPDTPVDFTASSASIGYLVDLWANLSFVALVSCILLLALVGLQRLRAPRQGAILKVGAVALLVTTTVSLFPGVILRVPPVTVEPETSYYLLPGQDAVFVLVHQYEGTTQRSRYYGSLYNFTTRGWRTFALFYARYGYGDIRHAVPVVDSAGTVHLFWIEEIRGNFTLVYRSYCANGTLHPARDVDVAPFLLQYTHAFHAYYDPARDAAWLAFKNETYAFHASVPLAEGRTSGPPCRLPLVVSAKLFYQPGYSRLDCDPNGTTRLFFTDTARLWVTESHDGSRTWTTPACLLARPGLSYFRLARAGPDLFLTWPEDRDLWALRFNSSTAFPHGSTCPPGLASPLVLAPATRLTRTYGPETPYQVYLRGTPRISASGLTAGVFHADRYSPATFRLLEVNATDPALPVVRARDLPLQVHVNAYPFPA